MRTAGFRVFGREPELGKGILAGLVGGLVGAIMMTQFQNVWTKVSEALKNSDGQQAPDNHEQSEQQKGRQEGETEDATMKAAGKIASLSGRQLSHEQKRKLGPIVHYSFGTLQGAAYGL